MRYFVFFFLLLGPMLAQRPGEEQDIINAAVATFDGTLRVLDKKQLVLELVGDQSLTIVVNKKTQFMRGTKIIAAQDVRVGALVIVEAKKVMSELVAVRVRVKDTD